MSLSKAFNADGERKERLDLLEKALLILNAQREASHRTRSMHGEIAETRRYLWSWGGVSLDGETMITPQPNNPRAAEIIHQQRNLQAFHQKAAQEIAVNEGGLVAVMTKIFDGDAAKLQKFYAGADTLQTPKSAQWTDIAAAKYFHPENAAIDSATAITAATVKFASLKLIDQQTDAINAMIDQGKFGNKAKRIAWQAGKALKA